MVRTTKDVQQLQAALDLLRKEKRMNPSTRTRRFERYDVPLALAPVSCTCGNFKSRFSPCCDACENREASARLRRSRRQNGFCAACGKQAENYYCEGCGELNLASQRRWRERNKGFKLRHYVRKEKA